MPEAIDDAALDALFRVARSQNGWLDRPLPDGAPEAIWALASLGPTSANTEPMRVVWCVTAEARAQLASMASEANRPKITAAPATAIIGYDLEFYEKLPELFPHTDARPWFTGNPAGIEPSAIRNGTLQAAYLMLAARALGLDVGPMSGFDQAAVDEAFFGGTPVRSNFLCSIGYGDPAKVFERLPRLGFDAANTVI